MPCVRNDESQNRESGVQMSAASRYGSKQQMREFVARAISPLRNMFRFFIWGQP